MSKEKIIPTVIFSLFVILLTSIYGCNNQRRFKADGSLENFTVYLNETIPEIMDDYDVPGMSIAVIQKGETVWTNAYGYADVERKIKMKSGDVFRVESISKSVTAWGVMKLVEKGQIDLDAPIQKYLGEWKLPESEYSAREITVRKLLSHNAGMPLGTIGNEYLPDGFIPSLRETLADEAVLEKEPGSGFSYSNAGFNLLELIIEEVSGKDFAEYMNEEIFLPLGMKNSSFVWNDSLCATLPVGYDLNGKAVEAYVYPAKASGGLFAAVSDVARFVSAGMIAEDENARVLLKRKAIYELYSPRVEIPGIFGAVADSYGYGHFIEELPDGRRAVWHGGQGHGWMSHFHFVPQSGDGIVILTNSQRSWPVIAQILNDWAEWSGAGSVKMRRILYGIFAMRVLIWTLILFSISYASLLIYEIRRGRRTISFQSNSGLLWRGLKAFTGIVIIAALIWAWFQPYLIVSSIFPVLSVWAGYSLFVFALILVSSSLFFVRERGSK